MAAEWRAALPGWRAGAPLLACELLGEGSGGDVWRVATPEGDWVVKRRRHADFAVDAARMHALQNFAAEHGIAPRLLAVDPAGGVEVGEFARGRAVTDLEFARPDFLLRVAGRMRRLHAAPWPAAWRARRDWHFDIAAHLDIRLQAAAARWPSERLRELPRLLAASGAGTRADAVLHLDVHASNVLAGQELMLLDWEYASLGDPVWDLASLTAGLPGDHEWLAALLGAAGRAQDCSVEQLLAARQLFQWLNELWQLRHGPDGVCAGSRPAI